MSFEDYMVTDDYEPSGQFDDIVNKGIQAQPDRPTISAKELKRAFDTLALLCIDGHNRLCQAFGTEDILAEFTVRTVAGGKTNLKQLLTTLTGSGGAAALGALDLEGHATTIQAAFDALRDYVNSTKINATIPTGGFTSAAIKPGGIVGESLADSAVTEGKIANAAVTQSKIADGAATESKIADAAVTQNKIANAAVTESKIAGGAVTQNKIANGSVTSDKISADFRNYVSNSFKAVNADIDQANTRIDTLEKRMYVTATGVKEWNFIRISDEFVIASITKDLGEVDLGDGSSWRTKTYSVRTPFRFAANAAVMVSAQFGLNHHHLVLDSHSMQNYMVKASNSDGVTVEHNLTQIDFRYISVEDKHQSGTTPVTVDIVVIGRVEEVYNA